MFHSSSRVALLVNQQDLEGDDRWGWFAASLQGDTLSIAEIAKSEKRSIANTIAVAKLLFDEGYLEIVT